MCIRYSPYDRLIIDRHVRFVGDVVAIVAAETEEAAEKALGRIKVTYNAVSYTHLPNPAVPNRNIFLLRSVFKRLKALSSAMPLLVQKPT